MFLPLLFGSLAVLLLTVLAWPVSALVRRHYGVQYALSGQDARAHRWIRIASLAVLVVVRRHARAVVVSMMSNLDLMTPEQDGLVIAMRVAGVDPVAARRRSSRCGTPGRCCAASRSQWAKLWAIVLAAAFLSLLFIGFACHVIGFTADY